MSDAAKPVEEPVVAPAPATETETPVADPVPEVKAAEEPVTETPATTEEAAPAKEEAKPVEEGVLGYKAPGLLKSLFAQKKFFWFGSEPVEVKNLHSYLRGEKQEANHNAAWASHTGKGLLFFSKKSSEKATPAGIINLSEASDITHEGPIAFHFNIGTHKHTFEASTLAERDGWVSALKTKIAEAKEIAPSVKEHETYKENHEKLSKPAVTAAPIATAKKSVEVKKEEKAEAKEEKKEEKAEAKEEKKEEKKEVKERKSRSASRKRASIFGSIPGFGKKEEKTEAKEETPAVAPASEPVVEPTVEEAAPATEAPVATEPVPTIEEPAAPVEVKPTTEAKPTPTKRNSIFGTLKSQFSHKAEKKEEAAPVVPAKDAEPVSETAPVIPAVESSEPLAASVVSPATAPVETTEAPVTNGETKTETPAVKNDKRKSSLPWLNKTDKATSDEESEKPKSPFAKLRATIKGKSSPKAEKPAEKATEPAVEKTSPEPEAKPEEPVVSEPTPVVNTSTPQVSATA